MIMRTRVLSGVLIAIAFLNACRQQASVQAPLTPVRIAPVEIYTGDEGSRYSASIVPYAQVDLAFKSGGYVDSIVQRRGADGRMREIQQGDWAQKGDVLATVRQQDYRDQLKQAQAQLTRSQAVYENAKLSFDRATALFNATSITKPEYDNAKKDYDSAVAAVDDAKAALGLAQTAYQDCSLTAPIDGWILKRNVEVGSLVGPSVIGFTIADTRLVKAVFGVPDTVISRVQLGKSQVVTSDALEQPFVGKITAVSPAADPKSRVYSVEVTIPNPQDLLKAGMIASLTVGGRKLARPVPSVPLSALVQSPGKGFAVFVVEALGAKTVARLRNVELAEPQGNRMGVVQGVTPGENVIVTGATLVKDGEAVVVIP
jgi:RND family efflux transporter MFP subunit